MWNVADPNVTIPAFKKKHKNAREKKIRATRMGYNKI
jgi:hypothetical protein